MAVAVTGDIGAGKSTVSRLLAERLGYERIDADVIALALWEREDIKAQAVRRWGRSILNASGEVIRSEVARHIFTDKTEHDFCNALLHPIVMLQLRELGHSAVLEIPLLAEVGRPDWIDRVVYVTADFRLRAERCRLQRGWSSEELRRRESFLLPQSVRMSISDYTIHNESDISELERQIGEVISHEHKRSSRKEKHTRKRQMES